MDADLIHHRQQAGDDPAVDTDLLRHLHPQRTDPLAHGRQPGQLLLYLAERQQGRILRKTLQQAIHHLALGRQGIAELVAAGAEETGRHAALFLQLMGQLRRFPNHIQRGLGLAHLLFDPIAFIHVPAGEKQQGQQWQADNQQHLVRQSQLLHPRSPFH